MQLWRSMIVVFLAAVVVSCGSPTLVSTSDFAAKYVTGLTAVVPAHDQWFRHPGTEKTFMENWSITVHLDSGPWVMIQFLYSNIGVFSGSSGISASVDDGKGYTHYFTSTKAQEDFVEDKAKGTIRVTDDNVMTIGDTVTVDVDFEGFSAQLVLTPTTEGIQFGDDGKVWLDKDQTSYFESYYHVPHATVTGSITVDGLGTFDAEGVGDVNHNISNLSTSEYSTHWYTLRAMAKEHSVTIQEIHTTEDYGSRSLARLAITGPGGLRYATGTYTLVPSKYEDDPDGYAYPTLFTLDVTDGPLELHGTYTVIRPHTIIDVLANLGWAQRQVVKVFAGKPMMYRQIVTCDLTLTVDGATIPFKEEGIVEYIVMHDPLDGKTAPNTTIVPEAD